FLGRLIHFFYSVSIQYDRFASPRGNNGRPPQPVTQPSRDPAIQSHLLLGQLQISDDKYLEKTVWQETLTSLLTVLTCQYILCFATCPRCQQKADCSILRYSSKNAYHLVKNHSTEIWNALPSISICL